MDNETTQTLSAITIALIAGGSALISAIVTSLLAPIVQNFLGNKNKKVEYKIKLITDSREILDKSKTLAEVEASSMWGFINDNLNDDEKERIESDALSIQIDRGLDANLTQDEIRMQCISNMLSRLEKKWGLLK